MNGFIEGGAYGKTEVVLGTLATNHTINWAIFLVKIRQVHLEEELPLRLSYGYLSTNIPIALTMAGT